MSLSSRYYIFAPDGLQRISRRLMEGLCHGDDAMPQFADTKQRVASVNVEIEAGKPARIVSATGSFLHFDKKGKVHESLSRSAMEATETFDELQRSKRIHPSKIVDLTPKLNREKWERDNRWELSAKDLDLISSDLWKTKKATMAKVVQAKGTKQVAPQITHEARQAIREIQTNVFNINRKVEYLSEPALKGLAFEARSLASKELNGAIWLGVAAAADRRIEILARYRSGTGVWYASIEILRWDRSRHSGEMDSLVHEKCNSKKEAEEAARRLLADNAKYFTAENSVEARVECDLEWFEDRTDGDE